jgi:hypothetical protein
MIEIVQMLFISFIAGMVCCGNLFVAPGLWALMVVEFWKEIRP